MTKTLIVGGRGMLFLYVLAAGIYLQPLMAQDAPQTDGWMADSLVAEWEELRASARPSTLLTVQLASDLPEEEAERWKAAIDRLQDEVLYSELEFALAARIFDPTPDAAYQTLIEVSGDRAVEDLVAAAGSYARYEGAWFAGDHEQALKQREHGRALILQAAPKLKAAAQANMAAASELEGTSFGIRRSAGAAAPYHADLVENGLSPEQHQLLLASGFAEREVPAFLEEVRRTDPEKVGSSMVEMHRSIAGLREEMAARLTEYAERPGLESPGPMMSAFTIGNPKEVAATIDLHLLRASIPPDWKLTIVPVDSVDAAGMPLRVDEADAGRHYQVELPAKSSVKLATILTTAGLLGEGTTARWSVEGRIGDELLGGVVQEMHVPGGSSMAGSAPPPTAAMGLPPAQEQPGGWNWWWAAILAGGFLLLGLVLLMLWRRRRTGRSASP